MKHTKGPWNVIEAYGTETVMADAGLTIAVTDHRTDLDDVDFSPDSEANARLIASAPQLFSSLVALLNVLESYRSEIGNGLGSDLYAVEKDARAAIAKARGEK